MSNDVLAGVLTRQQLADELDVTVRTLERWHTERTGPPRIKIGRRIYYRREAVDAWLRAHEQAEPMAVAGVREA